MYTEHFSTKKTPQTSPIPDKAMAMNSAGGYSFKLDPMKILERFLILGSEGGTYYASEKKLTVENAKNIVDLIKQDGPAAVNSILDISTSGRAAKPNPSIFALALCCSFGDAGTKAAAYAAISKVCKTGTQIFTFCQYIQDLRGWSRGLRSSVAKFYLNRTPEQLGYQLIKYRQRDGWTHRDVLRLCHPKTRSTKMNSLFKWAVGKPFQSIDFVPPQVSSFILAQTEKDHKKIAEWIVHDKLPREAIPTEMLKHKVIWEALLQEMPMNALVRNLGVMTANGVLTSNFDDNTKHVCEMLTDEARIKKSKLHPYAILLALSTYSKGHGLKGKLTWNPVQRILTALDDAFYSAFQNIETTNKNIMIGLDVSASMDGSFIHNSSLSAREASSAMALVTARKEPNHQIMAFTHQLVKVNIDPRARLTDVIQSTRRLPFGGTDCSQPIIVATQLKLPIDTFIIYTDSETWAGPIHPKQALDQFRQKMGRDAKMIVVGMTSNGFTIADPNDVGMMDVVGFDTAAPSLISDFMR